MKRIEKRQIMNNILFHTDRMLHDICRDIFRVDRHIYL